MPPTFKLAPPSDLFIIGIDKNDRGEWKFQSLLSCGCEFIGFGGENTLLILLSHMQSGYTHVVIIHAVVDSTIIHRETMNHPGTPLIKTINHLVADMLNYPEELPTSTMRKLSRPHQRG